MTSGNLLWICILILTLAATMAGGAPTASNVKVVPENATAGDDLTCSFDYSSPENFSEQKSAFEWWKNDVDQNINEQTLNQNNLSVNDEWYCKVTPSDGLANGTKVQSSNNVTIASTVQNVKMYVNDSLAWNTSDYYSIASVVSGFDEKLSAALELCTPDADGFCDVSLTFDSDDSGLLNVTNLEIYYELPVVSLAVRNLSAIYSNNTEHVFEFVIENNATGQVNNVTWTFDLGDGVVVNGTENASLGVGEEIYVYVGHNYSEEAEYTVTAQASAVADGVSAVQTLNIGSVDLDVANLTALYSNGSDYVFEFTAANNAGSNLSVNWTLDFGDGTVVVSGENANLSDGGSLFVFARYNYSSTGDFVVTATAQAGSDVDSESISFEVADLDVGNLSVINVSGTKRTFEFTAANLMDAAIQNVSWGFDTGDSFKVNSSVNAALTPGENFFVFIEYDYGGSGGFTVNASAANDSVADYEVLNVTVN